jgi:hypothetical protein
VIEQRAAVRFLTLKKVSAIDITVELEGVHGREALSLSAVKKWRKRFVNMMITLEDDPCSERLPRSNPYEFLRALIDEAPFISCERMCQKLRIPKTTCVPVLHEDLGFRKRYLRWVPHSITENEAQRRVTFFEELFQVVRHAKETNFEHLFSVDESWFYYGHRHDSA